MLKEQARIFNKLSIFCDLMVVVLAFLLGYLIRDSFGDGLLSINRYLWSLLVILPVWYCLLAKNRLFSSIRQWSILEITMRLINVHFWGAIIVASTIYFVDREQFSRGLIVAFVGFSFLLLVVEKACLLTVLKTLRRHGYNQRYLIIVGVREKAEKFAQMIENHQGWGLQIAGFVQASPKPLKTEMLGYKVLGHIDSLIEICKEHPVDELVFCLPKDMVVDAETYLQDLEEMGVTVRMALDFYNLPLYRQELSFFHDDVPILTFHAKSLDAQQLLSKRVLDIFGALVGLMIMIFILPFVALAIKMNSPGPVFFGQRRLGQVGRQFTCWKFRSMCLDAEQRKAELFDKNEMNGAIFKIKDDPRVTSFGKFLRKTSLDEFPQFWNVLKGEMSLVGTRPPTPEEVVLYQNWQRRRISIKPGITGLWQVSGRNEVKEFDDIVRMDLSYIDNWSLLLDLKIILKTVWIVLTSRDSY